MYSFSLPEDFLILPNNYSQFSTSIIIYGWRVNGPQKIADGGKCDLIWCQSFRLPRICHFSTKNSLSFENPKKIASKGNLIDLSNRWVLSSFVPWTCCLRTIDTFLFCHFSGICPIFHRFEDFLSVCQRQNGVSSLDPRVTDPRWPESSA